MVTPVLDVQAALPQVGDVVKAQGGQDASAAESGFGQVLTETLSETKAPTSGAAGGAKPPQAHGAAGMQNLPARHAGLRQIVSQQGKTGKTQVLSPAAPAFEVKAGDVELPSVLKPGQTVEEESAPSKGVEIRTNVTPEDGDLLKGGLSRKITAAAANANTGASHAAAGDQTSSSVGKLPSARRTAERETAQSSATDKAASKVQASSDSGTSSVQNAASASLIVHSPQSAGSTTVANVPIGFQERESDAASANLGLSAMGTPTESGPGSAKSSPVSGFPGSGSSLAKSERMAPWSGINTARASKDEAPSASAAPAALERVDLGTDEPLSKGHGGELSGDFPAIPALSGSTSLVRPGGASPSTFAGSQDASIHTQKSDVQSSFDAALIGENPPGVTLAERSAPSEFAASLRSGSFGAGASGVVPVAGQPAQTHSSLTAGGRAAASADSKAVNQTISSSNATDLLPRNARRSVPSSPSITDEHTSRDDAKVSATSHAASASKNQSLSAALTSSRPDVTHDATVLRDDAAAQPVHAGNVKTQTSVPGDRSAATTNSADGTALMGTVSYPAAVHSPGLESPVSFAFIAGVTPPASGVSAAGVVQGARAEPRDAVPTSVMAHIAEPLHTVTATPTSLEVGVHGGTEGWLKIRAEVGERGQVAAALTASSPSSAQSLKEQLPALNAYLHSEQMSVSTSVVERSGLTHGVTAHQVGHTSLSTATSSSGQDASLLRGGSQDAQGNERRQDSSTGPHKAVHETDVAGPRYSQAAVSGTALSPLTETAAGEPSGQWLNVTV